MKFEVAKEMVLSELNLVFDSVDEEEIISLTKEICSAEKVFVVGVGRVLLMMQAFVKRLNHLGIEAHFVGSISEPAITNSDLLIVGSGSGESVIPLAIVKIAKRYDATVAHIGSNTNSSMTPYEDLFVRIPCRTKLSLEGEIDSKQVMSSLFEQSLLLVTDMIAMLIVEEKGIDDLSLLWQKHANLE